MTPSLFLRQAAVRLQLQRLSSYTPRPTTAGLPPAAAAFSGMARGFSSLSRFAAGAAGARPVSAAVAAVVPPLRGGHHHQSGIPLVAAAPPPPPPPAAAASSSASLGAVAAAAAAGILRPRGRAAGAGAGTAAGGSTVSSRPAAAALRSTWGPCGSGRFGLGCTYTAKRTYLHFNRTLPEDFELPADTMPSNVGELLSKNPKDMDFFENYWYWKLRGEATVLDPESLPKKSYKQLARDMGMQVVNEETEHMVGLLELYEHLKTATFVGPFGTIEKPVLCPSVTTDRIVGCTGGAGDKEHVPLWFRCREGFLYRCGECDQIFMLVRVFYSLPDGKDPFPVDPDVDDVFDAKLLEKGERMWNSAEYVHWPAGHAAYSQLFLEGKWGNTVPEKLSQELRALEA